MSLIIVLLQVSNQVGQQSVPIWTIIATFAAMISAFSAFKSRGFAKKSFELARQNYNDRQSNFSLYLIDAYRSTTKSGPKRKFLLFHVTLFNKSDAKTSLKAELEIEYLRSDNTVSRVIVPHDENYKKALSIEEVSAFSNDIRLEEKGMQSKWLIFEQPQSIFNEYRIEKYMIKAADSLGNVQDVECSIVKEFENELEDKKS